MRRGFVDAVKILERRELRHTALSRVTAFPYSNLLGGIHYRGGMKFENMLEKCFRMVLNRHCIGVCYEKWICIACDASEVGVRGVLS